MGDGGEIEAVGEHRCVLQHHPFLLVEEFVGPLHGVAQCLVAFQAAACSGEETEPVTESITDIGRAHRHHAYRRKFDGKRDAIESGADLGHCGRVGSTGRAETDDHRSGPFHEQLHRGRVCPGSGVE